MSRDDWEAMCFNPIERKEVPEELVRQCMAKLEQTSAAIYGLLHKDARVYAAELNDYSIKLASEGGTVKARLVFTPDFSKDLAHMCEMKTTVTTSSKSASRRVETLDALLSSSAAELGMEQVDHEVTRAETMRNGKPAKYEHTLTRRYTFGFR